MTRTLTSVAALIFFILIQNGCGGAAPDKIIQSVRSNGLTITLAGPNGGVKRGENNLTLLFADSNGRGVNVGTVALRFHMPAMGQMAEMTDPATLISTGSPGRYTVKVNLESAGQWEALVNYQGSLGAGKAEMQLNAR